MKMNEICELDQLSDHVLNELLRVDLLSVLIPFYTNCHNCRLCVIREIIKIMMLIVSLQFRYNSILLGCTLNRSIVSILVPA